MENKLIDLIDFKRVNSLLEGFNKTTGFLSAILDLEGNVLSKSEWRQICTDFHRLHPETAKKCKISDTELAGNMAEGKKYQFYKCLNGLVDVAVPIIINGEHIANLFSGQFFFEKPNRELFKKQAEKYNFDTTKYLDALEKVPVLSAEKVKTTMDFLLDMLLLISEMTAQKKEQVQLNNDIKNNEERFRTIIDQAGDAMYLCNFEGDIKMVNNHSCEMLGYSTNEFLAMKIGDLDVNIVDQNLQKELWNKLELDKPQTLLSTHKRKDGLHIPIEIRHTLINIDGTNAILGFVRDITARKRAEQKAHESEQTFRALFEKGPIGVAYHKMIYDQTGKAINYLFLDANDSYKKLTGVNPIGKLVTEAFPGIENDPFDWIGTFGKVAKTGKDIRVQQYFELNNRWYNCIAYQYKPDHFVAAFLEITELKKAEKALREKEILLNKTQKISKVGGWSYNVISGESKLTDETYNIYGLPIGDHFEAENGMKYYHPNCQKTISEAFSKIISEGKAYDLEVQFINTAGEHLWVRTIGNPLFEDGKVVQINGILMDITARKQAEIELTKNEFKFRTLADFTSDWEYWQDENKHIIYMSPSCKKVSGYTQEEFISSPEKLNAIVHPEDILRVNDHNNRIHKNAPDLGKNNLEFRIIKKDNSIVHLSHICRPIYDEEHNYLGQRISNRDITERKLVEEKLKESEEKFRTLYDNAPLSYQSLNEDGSFKDINPTWLSTLGYERNEVIGKFYKDFLHPSWHAHFEDNFPKFKKRGYVNDVQFRIRHKDGHYLDIAFEGCIGYHPDGSFKQTYCVFTDITERKKAEEEIKNQIAKWQATFNAMSNSVSILDLEGNISQYNEATVKMFNLNEKGIKGKKCFEVVHGTSTFFNDCPLVRMKTSHQRESMIFKEKERWLEVHVDPIFNSKNKLIGVVHVVSDITERKLTEEELRINEEKLNLIIDTSPIGICTVDAIGNFVKTNKAYERIVGYTKEELLGLSFFDVTHINDRPKNKKLFQDMFSLNTTNFSIEKKYVRKDGKEVIVSVNGIGINDSTNNTPYATAFIQDITERKLVEQTILISNKRYKSLFNDSPIPLWEEEITDLLSYLLDLKEKGHKNLLNYFENNPNELMKCVGMIKILDVNQAALGLHKAQSKKQLIENLSETFTENSFNVFQEELIALAEGKEIFESESEVKTLQGDLKNIHITFKIDKSQTGKVKALVATSDITERKQVEELLLENRNRLDYALSSIETGAWELDLETMGSWRMLKHDQIFGHNEPLDEWTYDMFLEHVIPEDRKIVNQKFQHAVATKTDWNFECRIKRYNDGEIRWIWANGNQEFDGGKEFGKMFGIVQDITERKQAEQELTKYRENLEELVEKRTIELKDKYSELERLNKLFVGRELRMIELKEKIKVLENKQSS